MISMIVAMEKNSGIGKNNAMLWHLPEDFKFFKANTINKTVIMGRKTYESIGKPLPNRQNIVVTENHKYKAEGVDVVYSIEEALKKSTSKSIMIIGGAAIYEQCLPECELLYITKVDASIEADVYFPDYNSFNWKLLHSKEHLADEKNKYNMSFSIYQKIKQEQK